MLREFRRLFGFPKTYAVIDCETTGFSRERDLIIDLGFADVVDDALKRKDSFLLNWAGCVDGQEEYYADKLRHQAADYAAQGLTHSYDWERLCRDGKNPREVLSWLSAGLRNSIDQGNCVVGHGFVNFDAPMISANIQRSGAEDFYDWGDLCLVDTGLIEKAIQLEEPPLESETMLSWYKRVNRPVAGVKWALAKHCQEKYRVMGDDATPHTGLADVSAIHKLMNIYKGLL